VKPVRLTPTADADVLRAAAWYEVQKEGLGAKFLDRVEHAVKRIAEAPLGHQKVIRDARKVELQRFPYALWYTVDPEENVVIACLHGRRDRVLAKERALGVVEMPKPEGPI
jgi:toxin ParE1/3/4